MADGRKGGLHALKGFQYQGVVGLDLLLSHFEGDDGSLRSARPEGEDDIVLKTEREGDAKLHFIQVKKPREDDAGVPKNDAWRLAEVVSELLPGTIERLKNSTARQTWILGDELASDARELLDPRGDARLDASAQYLRTVFLLARNAVGVLEASPVAARKELARWKPTASTADGIDAALTATLAAFDARLSAKGAAQGTRAAFAAEVVRLDGILPDVLSRLAVMPGYGRDDVVAGRVTKKLAERYGLSIATIETSVLRNMRSWMNEVATSPDRWVDAVALDYELRCVWPEMATVRLPPAPREGDLPRPELVDEVLMASRSGPVEVIGISGAGKTTLASLTHAQALARHDGHVLYAEVRSAHTLRDVLVGVAFHLHREEGAALFELATRNGLAEHDAITRLATIFRSLKRPLLLLLDFVEGLCEVPFARALAQLVSGVDTGFFKIVTFAQQSSLRELSPFQRSALGVPAAIEALGLDFEEFQKLVSRYHFGADRSLLWSVFQHFTAGRSTGLAASLADLLARTKTLAAMKALTALPLADALREAERERFGRVATRLRFTAEKLVCFVMPFRLEEAERVFAALPTSEAVRELVNLGLLRAHGTERFEMHETVRVGLETLLPAESRRAANSALAAYYDAEGNVPAAVYHYRASGELSTADRIAHEAFLNGDHRAALLHYVARHNLVTLDEVCACLHETPSRSNTYFFPDLLREMSTARGQSARIVKVIEEGEERFRDDFQWAWLVVECALACDPASLADLVSVVTRLQTKQKPDLLAHVLDGARRQRASVDVRLLSSFDAASKEQRKLLARFLALDPNRETLGRALRFWSEEDSPKPWRHPNWMPGSGVVVRSESHVVDFLASLPTADPNEMIAYRSACFGRLGDLIWEIRRALQPVCRTLLAAAVAEDAVLINALRVLLFLGDEQMLSFAEALQERKTLVGTLARLIPVLVANGPKDLSRLRAQVLDASLSLELRLTAFSMLSLMGVDVGSLYEEAVRLEPEREQLWSFQFLMQCVVRPDKRVVPLLEKSLANATAKEHSLLVPVLMKLGELPGADVTEFLLRAIANPAPKVRAVAAVALQQRRQRAALVPLLEVLDREPDANVGQLALIAAIASGPSRATVFDKAWERFPDSTLWRSIVAGRLRDVAEADHLVEVAVDRTRHWQLRRAAILAAGRLPFERALVHIAPEILAERSSFVLDRGPSLAMHQNVAALLLDFTPEMRARAARGRATFLETFGPIFEDAREDSWAPEKSPSGDETAAWLFDRLCEHGWPADGAAADRVLDELHVPILHAAVLRGARLCGQLDLLEENVSRGDSEWLVMRALSELGKAGVPERLGSGALGRLVEGSPFAGSPFVKNVIRNISPTEQVESSEAEPARDESTKPHSTSLNREDAQTAIGTGVLGGAPPFVLVGLDESSFSELARELVPARDQHTKWVSADAHLSFTSSGLAVGGVRREAIERNHSVRSTLRPALAAANRFRSTVEWHRDLLSLDGYPGGDVYAAAFLASLGATRDPARLAEEFEMNGDLLLAYCTDYARVLPIEKLISAGLIPFLRRYAHAGSDSVLEFLAWMAARIDDEEIDPVLKQLFDRWRGRFDFHERAVQHRENTSLWRAFGSLSRHARFTMIQDYDLRLVELLQRTNLAWYQKQDVVEALASSPRTYIFHETMLFRAAPFEHFHHDEIDRLDPAADDLFQRTRE